MAFGGARRRHGRTQRGKLVRLDPGRGPGTDFEPILKCLSPAYSETGCPDLKDNQAYTDADVFCVPRSGSFRPPRGLFSRNGTAQKHQMKVTRMYCFLTRLTRSLVHPLARGQSPCLPWGRCVGGWGGLPLGHRLSVVRARALVEVGTIPWLVGGSATIGRQVALGLALPSRGVSRPPRGVGGGTARPPGWGRGFGSARGSGRSVVAAPYRAGAPVVLGLRGGRGGRRLSRGRTRVRGGGSRPPGGSRSGGLRRRAV